MKKIQPFFDNKSLLTLLQLIIAFVRVTLIIHNDEAEQEEATE